MAGVGCIKHGPARQNDARSSNRQKKMGWDILLDSAGQVLRYAPEKTKMTI